MRIITLCLLAGCNLHASVKLTATPQKFSTFYSVGDKALPAAITSGRAIVATTTDGATWTATANGLTRFDKKESPSRQKQLFAGKRYLPDDRVESVTADGTGVWVRTSSGFAHIELRMMTLGAKAEAFEARVAARHDRHGLVADSRLQTAGDLATSKTQPSDNDGLWTAIYSTAAAYRYALQPTQQNLARARKAIEAILFLEEVTGRPGFPARSIVNKNEQKSSDGMWHLTPNGEWRFKGDTSSDEIVGHFFALGIAWDLLPDQQLKGKIKATTARIMDHILDHDLTLTDITGFPTYWGRWDEDYFASARGHSDSPLNAIEILSFLKTAHHITGNPRYRSEYVRLALQRKYAELATKELEFREEINYSDEELAFLPFYLLFRYEKDPKLLGIYRKALDGWWENARREKNPLWTFIYQLANPSKKADLDGAVETLYRIPMDQITWRVTNSGRPDVEMEVIKDRFSRPQSKQLLPADERPVMRWNGNPFRIDGGNNGASEDDGAYFLLPYWMGRYHKLLSGE